MNTDNTQNAIEIIENQLYWISDRNPPKNQRNAYFFCIDQDLVYDPFYADFGPLDLGKTYRFVTELEKLLKDQNFLKYKIYHHTSMDTAKRANAAYLMGAFQIIILGRTAEESWKPFTKVYPSFADFRDACFGPCTYKCTILDCLRGLEYAIKLKWFDVRNFNIRDYQFYEKPENGDLNWIIPGKFVAFSGPSSVSQDPHGWRSFTPEDYVPIFRKLGVNLVVRLNNKQYEASRFTQNGIKHLDLYFLDGSCPSDRIVDNFLEASEQETGAVAVHCKAGLGRTGTLIACYAMKHYKFPAADFIGWIRICRPGSVLGPQQQYLIDKQDKYFALSEISPIWRSISNTVKDKCETQKLREISLNKEDKATMSPEDKLIAQYGDYGQANRLLSAKKMQNSPGLATKSDSPNQSTSTNTLNNMLNCSPSRSYQPSAGTNLSKSFYEISSKTPPATTTLPITSKTPTSGSKYDNLVNANANTNTIIPSTTASNCSPQISGYSYSRQAMESNTHSSILNSHERNKSQNSHENKYDITGYNGNINVKKLGEKERDKSVDNMLNSSSTTITTTTATSYHSRYSNNDIEKNYDRYSNKYTMEKSFERTPERAYNNKIYDLYLDKYPQRSNIYDIKGGSTIDNPKERSFVVDNLKGGSPIDKPKEKSIAEVLKGESPFDNPREKSAESSFNKSNGMQRDKSSDNYYKYNGTYNNEYNNSKDRYNDKYSLKYDTKYSPSSNGYTNNPNYTANQLYDRYRAIYGEYKPSYNANLPSRLDKSYTPPSVSPSKYDPSYRRY